jgi:hypothetical protein
MTLRFYEDDDRHRVKLRLNANPMHEFQHVGFAVGMPVDDDDISDRARGSPPAACHADEADHSGDNSSDQHPNRFVRRGAGEESGNIGAERCGRVHSDHNEHHAPGEQGDGNGLIHGELSEAGIDTRPS